MDLSVLPMPVSAGIEAGAANRVDEKPGSYNCNLPGVAYALELARESAVGLNSLPASSAARISPNS